MPDFAWFEDPLPDGHVIAADDTKTAVQIAADRLSTRVEAGDTATMGVWVGRRFEFTVDATGTVSRVVRVKP